LNNFTWKGKVSYRANESFIFSLTDGKGRSPYQLYPYQNFQCCLYHHSSYGPYFGGGNEFRLSDLSTITNCYSNINGTTYKLPDGYEGQAQTFLAGQYNNWNVQDIEIYLI